MLTESRKLGFAHPATEAPLHWTMPLPGDLAKFLKKLRRITPQVDLRAVGVETRRGAGLKGCPLGWRGNEDVDECLAAGGAPSVSFWSPG